MPSTYNPTRRNKNIGTTKSGHSSDNKLTVPNRFSDSLNFWERIYDYKIIKKKINSKTITFLIEKTKKDYLYTFTIVELTNLLKKIPREDWMGIELFVLRQPKKKEIILDPVWGRLSYEADFKGYKGPAIFLEAINVHKAIVWPNSLTPESKKELKRLEEDGHKVIQNKKNITIHITKDSAKNTQLFRTLLHEIGHFVHWNTTVLQPAKNTQDLKKLKTRYLSIPEQEKETFAHRYAEKIRKKINKIT